MLEGFSLYCCLVMERGNDDRGGRGVNGVGLYLSIWNRVWKIMGV